MKKGILLISNLAVLVACKKNKAEAQVYIQRKGICIALASFLLTGCYQQFYTTGTKEPPITQDLVNLRDWNKEIILHFEDSVVHLQDMTLRNDTLSGVVAILPMELSKKLKPNRKRSNGYQAREDPTTTNQAHIYVRGQLSNYIQPGETVIQIPHSKIPRMDVYEKDGTATALNYTMSTLAIIAGVLLTGLLIFAGSY